MKRTRNKQFLATALLVTILSVGGFAGKLSAQAHFQTSTSLKYTVTTRPDGTYGFKLRFPNMDGSVVYGKSENVGFATIDEAEKHAGNVVQALFANPSATAILSYSDLNKIYSSAAAKQ